MLALWPVIGSKVGRFALLGHVSTTLLGTANHCHLDAVGGAAVLAGGVLLSRRRRLPRLPSGHWLAIAGLLAAAVFVWAPKAESMLAAENVGAAALLLVWALAKQAGRAAGTPAAAGVLTSKEKRSVHSGTRRSDVRRSP